MLGSQVQLPPVTIQHYYGTIEQNLFQKIVYLFISERERVCASEHSHMHKQGDGQRKTHTPNAGLDPRTPGLWPKLKANRLSHPGPWKEVLKILKLANLFP